MKNKHAAFEEDSQFEDEGKEVPDLCDSDGEMSRLIPTSRVHPKDNSININLVGEERSQTNLNIGFQVADVKKPLLSVKRVCEKGSIVCFGPEASDNFIRNKQTGTRIP